MLAKWREHYGTMLNHGAVTPCANHGAATPCADLDIESSTAIPKPYIASDAPALEEVRLAIRKLKNGRAAGLGWFCPELLKCAEEPVSNALHELFQRGWRSSRVPVEWKDGVIVSLYKGKGPRNSCSSYQPITPLSVPGKVFCHVLLNRLEPLL